MNTHPELSATGQGVADSPLLTTFAALALVVLIMLLLAWLARRSGFSRHFTPASSGITVVSSQSLGARQRIVLVDIADRRLVLGVTASQITCLTTLDVPPATVAPSSALPAADFPALLRTLYAKYSGKS